MKMYFQCVHGVIIVAVILDIQGGVTERRRIVTMTTAIRAVIVTNAFAIAYPIAPGSFVYPLAVLWIGIEGFQRKLVAMEEKVKQLDSSESEPMIWIMIVLTFQSSSL